jgi:aminoglycoside phosphotransferase (APT) family kinase protein
MTAMTDRILERLVHHGLVSCPEGWTVAAAPGGLNSKVFFAGRQGAMPTFTVRSPAQGETWKLRRETAILKSLSGLGICVPRDVTAIDPTDDTDSLLLVHRYAYGTTAPLGSVTETQLATLAGCLATLHQVEQSSYAIWPDTQTGPGSLEVAFRRRLAAVTRYKTFTQPGNDALTRRIGHIYDRLTGMALDGELWHGMVFSQLHGDLSAGNIIWDATSVTLIDWEYARSGDPAEDLAYLFVEQPVSAGRYATFQRLYKAFGGDRSAFARVPAYSGLVALDSALWWADHAQLTGQAMSDTPEVHTRLESAEKALNVLR